MTRAPPAWVLAGGRVPDRRVDAVMPSAGSDVPYGGAGRVRAAAPGGSGDVPGGATEGDAAATPGRRRTGAGSPSTGNRAPRRAGSPAHSAPLVDGVVGKHSAGPPPTPGRLDMIRSEWRVMVVLVVAGLLTAALWRVLTPRVADSGNPLEADIAVDGTLAALGVVAGIITSACVLLRPG